MGKMTTRQVGNVTLQELNAAGLNPFACELLVESYARHENPPALTFVWRGVVVSLSVYPGPFADAEDDTATAPAHEAGKDPATFTEHTLTHDLRAAIANAGARPDVHADIMAQHRKEWPTLWAAIDRALGPSGGW